MHDYTSFQVYTSSKDQLHDSEYKREWYKSVLLMKKTPEVMYDASQTPDGTQQFQGQLTYNETIDKQYREFRVVEIIKNQKKKKQNKKTNNHKKTNQNKKKIRYTASQKCMAHKFILEWWL